MDEQKDLVKVKMFSQFEVSYQGRLLFDEQIRSNMLVKLFAYILCNHAYKIDVKDLCYVLWKDGESDNPGGALKNLFYRLRMILNTTFACNAFIKTLRGAYAWNNEFPVELDIELFEDKCNAARAETDMDRKVLLLEEAISLYVGDFLPAYTSEQWILQRSAYYHTLYVSCIKQLASLYEAQGSFEKMEILCINALKLEEFDEAVHCYLMKAYIHQNKKIKAEEHYKQTSRLLYSELGTSPSEEMQNLYQELLKETKTEEMDLSIIQKDLNETREESRGSYFCEYGVFKMIYVLQQRQAKRMGIAVFCGLITIKSEFSLPPSSDAYRRFRDQAMEELKKVLYHSLRSGDVVARYSPSQYVMLIPASDYEGGLVALDRIDRNFQEAGQKIHARLICNLREMEL